MSDAALAAGSPTMTAAPAPRTRLRVGVVLPTREIPAWQHTALARIAGSAYAELALVVLTDAEPAAIGGEDRTKAPGVLLAALRRVVERLDATMVCDADALCATDATSLLRDVPAIDAAGARCDALRAYEIDVFIDFASTDPGPAMAGSSRYGVWRLSQPYSASRDPAQACFWPVYHGWGIGEAILEQCPADGTPIALARARPATNLYSLRLNAAAMCWRMAAFLPHLLRQLHELGIDGLQARSPEKPASPVSRRTDPGPLELALYIARNVTRRARASAARRLLVEQWILMFHLGDALCTTPSKFRKIVPPKDRFWADPHLVRRDGRFYAFVEECPFATGKGRIAVLPIESDGTWGKALPVLERDYHLSYPFVFEHEGTLYMVPESEANRTIDLYRCVDFPARWEFVTTLLDDIAATDSTLLHRDGRWWLFANVLDVAGASYSEELHIFHSDSLTAGAWTPHRRNPVISDARRSRPAGAIIERDGRLLRPAQDCSARYGYGIRLHEIDTLTGSEYHETEVDRIEPTWDRRIVATHTLAYVPGLTMIDAVQPRLRFQRPGP